ncbi:hypothetical protein OIU77_006677 [Salix suchowensis]|uniref:Uncharacterized protein n=1 Tax=Salix suchowensis TaxID=1278906 RepID=A0ABQ9ALI1_9ROSI|nr:hypothetical protein OIU77_006677 [Salix suchowensis]
MPIDSSQYHVSILCIPFPFFKPFFFWSKLEPNLASLLLLLLLINNNDSTNNKRLFLLDFSNLTRNSNNVPIEADSDIPLCHSCWFFCYKKPQVQPFIRHHRH